MLAHQNDTYDLTTNNCTNVAVGAFNSVVTPDITMPTFPVFIPLVLTPIPIDQSPQELYRFIGSFNAVGNISKEYRVYKKAPDGSGECN